MNSIVKAPFSPEERENIIRYQADNRLVDRLKCPRMVDGKECEENYTVPGMFTFFPLYRNTILRLVDDQMYCPQCKVPIQDYVPFTIAKYTVEVQEKVHAELDAEIKQQCEDMASRAQNSREAVFTRLREELVGMSYTEHPSPPNQYYHYEFWFDDYPHLRLCMGYDGEISIQYSIGAFKSLGDRRNVQWFFRGDWKGSMKDTITDWAAITSLFPSYDVVPML